MKCTHCGKPGKALVLETRKDADGVVFRRRSCGHCGRAFATKEVPTDTIPDLRKSSRVTDRKRPAYDFGPLSGVTR